MTPRSIGFAALGFLALVLAWWLVPLGVYRFKEARPLEVAIVDKTVPGEQGRDVGYSARRSVEPITCPVRIPPPASSAKLTLGQ